MWSGIDSQTAQTIINTVVSHLRVNELTVSRQVNTFRQMIGTYLTGLSTHRKVTQRHNNLHAKCRQRSLRLFGHKEHTLYQAIGFHYHQRPTSQALKEDRALIVDTRRRYMRTYYRQAKDYPATPYQSLRLC